MPAQTWNGITTPVGTDGWNPVLHMKGLADTADVIVPVSSVAHRDGLAATAPGGVLPIPTTVVRTDIPGYPIEIWDGATWSRQVQSSPFITTDENWEYGGGLIRTRAQGFTLVQLIGTMKRIGGGNIALSSTTDILMGTYIPAGWRPTVPASAFAPVATGTIHNGEPLVTVDANGQMILHLGTGSMTIAVGATLNFCMGWYQ